MDYNRRAEKAGSWYPDDPGELTALLNHFLADARLQQPAPPQTGGKVAAGVVPHAGLAFSGGVAARTFLAMQDALPGLRTLLIFGAVHTMALAKAAVWPEGRWQSPLGPATVDAEAAQTLRKAELATADPLPHRGDNAIELQIPLIRHCFPECRIVPVAVPPNLESVRLGREAYALFRAQVETGELAVLASTDLTHYGECYGFAPAGGGEKGHAWSKQNDRRLLNLALQLQAEAIVPQAVREHSACGAGALAAATAFAAAAGCRQGELLEHTTSREILPRDSADLSVGYASLVFRA